MKNIVDLIQNDKAQARLKKRANGTGNVCELKDGRWKVSIQRDGRRFEFYMHTEEAARNLLNEILDLLSKGEALVSIKKFLVTNKAARKSERVYDSFDVLPEVGISAPLLADFLMVSISHANRLMEDGVLKSYQFGESRRTTKAFLEEFLKLQTSRSNGIIPSNYFKQ